jgi:RNA polymerase sigma factor (sigma-70 family)
MIGFDDLLEKYYMSELAVQTELSDQFVDKAKARWVDSQKIPMKVSSPQDRRDFWDWIRQTYNREILEKALQKLHPVDAMVLRWHYQEDRSLKEVALLLGRSISTARDYNNRGIFKLYLYLKT